VLVCDAGGATGGLASLAEIGTPRSLAEAAARTAQTGRPPDGLFAALREGLRLIAAGPRLREPAPDRAALARILADARSAHALTVLDCGVPGDAVAGEALAGATHVAWVLPASAGGLRRGAPLLRALEPDPRRRELVVARAEPGERRPPVAELSALAAERGGPLVLMPRVNDLSPARLAACVDEARPALDAVAAELRR
jgi:hypothetical protein